MKDAVMEKVALPEIREIPGSQATAPAQSKPVAPVVTREAAKAPEGERNGQRVPTNERKA